MRTRTSIAGNNRGFTLFELIIVLFIMGLAAAVVMISTGRIHDRAVFNDEARRLFQTIKHAREIALSERKVVSVKIDEENNKYWIDFGSDNPLSERPLPRKFSLKGETIIFFPKGNSSGGSVNINNGEGQEYSIRVDPVIGTPSFKRV